MKYTFTILFFVSCFLSIVNIADGQIPQGASFWLRADSGVVLSIKTVVSEWKDQSGTNKSAFQTLPTSQPTIIPQAINNLPAIHFDGRYEYMDCAPIFPISSDYSISIVTRISDFTHQNQVVSGNNHSIYLGGTTYPIVRNDTFPAPSAISHIALQANQPSILTVIYHDSIQSASIYVNGELADSTYIGHNLDPKIYLGAYQGIANFSGEIAEIILYKFSLTDSTRKQLEDYLFTKYAIIPTPAPDSIYSSVPKHLQFYARENDDSATVQISGNLYDEGFDSVYVKTFKKGVLIARDAHPLVYADGKAPFAFAPRIHAELSEYSFTFSEKNTKVDKQFGFRDSIVCGDVLLISGQSNSINNNLGYTNEFFRTYGINQSSSLGDTTWEISSPAVTFGPGPISGSFGERLQEDIMNTYNIPTCVINGGAISTNIAQHLPDTLNRININSIYGNMLYRSLKSGLIKNAKALFWYQGESDSLRGYENKFRTLYNAWKVDYPNLRKIYVMQIRPGCSLGFSEDVRDLLRTIQDTFPNIESVSTMGIPGHDIDNCHFLSYGYTQLGDQLFRLLARDYYGSNDNLQISSPNIIQAYYTNSAKTQIGLTFLPRETRFIIPNDTVIGGIPASIKDYFFLDDTAEVVQSISTSGNRIFLDLKNSSSAHLINYLPDKYYNHTSAIYEGPWLENTRGVGAFSFYHVPIVDSAQAGVISSKALDNMAFSEYPNPTNGKFIIHYLISDYHSAVISISDILGRIIYSTSLYDKNGNKVLDLRLSDGLYQCNLQIDGELQSISFLVRN